MSDWLLSCLLRSAFLGLLGAAVLAVLRQKSAAVRHALAVTALAGMLLLPLLHVSLPERPIPVLPATSAKWSPAVTLVLKPMRTAAPAPLPERDDAPSDALLWIWVGGVAACLVRLAWGLGTVRRWIRNGRPAPVSRPGVACLVVDAAKVPSTVWWGRHYVLLPGQWEDWSPDRLDAVLSHELAHVARGDWFSQVVSLVTCALFWPNPLAWWLNRQVRLYAELAADDRVLRSGVAPTRYAQDLLEIARETQAAGPALTLPMARKADVARRIEMILNDKMRRGSVTLAGLGLGLVFVAAVSVPLGTLALGRQSEPAPAQAAEKAPVQVLVGAYFMEPRRNLRWPLKNVTPTAEQKDGLVPAVTELSDKDAQRLLATAQKDGAILSSPRLFTVVGGRTAKISIGDLAFEVAIPKQSGNSFDVDTTVFNATQIGGQKVEQHTAETAVRQNDGQEVLLDWKPKGGKELMILVKVAAIPAR